MGVSVMGGRRGDCGWLAEGRSWKDGNGMRMGRAPEMEEAFFESFGNNYRQK